MNRVEMSILLIGSKTIFGNAILQYLLEKTNYNIIVPNGIPSNNPRITALAIKYTTNIDTLSALLDRLISENIKLFFFIYFVSVAINYGKRLLGENKLDARKVASLKSD